MNADSEVKVENFFIVFSAALNKLEEHKPFRLLPAPIEILTFSDAISTRT